MSLGYVAFPLSPRNNPIVTAHLLETTGATHVFVSRDTAMRSVIEGAATVLGKKGIKIDVFDMPRSSDYEQTSAHPQVVDIADDDVTIILHSSGTHVGLYTAYTSLTRS